jgi:hypothetical protein
MNEDTNEALAFPPEEKVDGRRKRRESPERDFVEITYVDEEGPSKTKCWGIDFKLNVPVQVPVNATVESLTRKETSGPEGEIRSRGVHGRISVVELARGNSGFMVDGVRAERRLGSQRLPTDADQYRGYAMGWIRETNTIRQLDQRWEGEANLREKCGCEQKDENYLRPFLDAKRDQLKEAA